VRGRPAYAAHGLKYAEDLLQAWLRLADLVRTGKPTMEPETILGTDKAKTRAFVFAMNERAKGMGSVLPHGADFSGRKRLLDVGGGPALLPRARAADAWPHLHRARSSWRPRGDALRIDPAVGIRGSRQPAAGNYLTSAFGSSSTRCCCRA
jgi:hypothetical protein